MNDFERKGLRLPVYALHLLGFRGLFGCAAFVLLLLSIGGGWSGINDLLRGAQRSVSRGACSSSADCSGGRGKCFLRECFCYPGVSGAHCEDGVSLSCNALSDQMQRLQCYNHPLYGSAEVDARTWRTAVDSEAAHWASSRGETSDRSEEHADGFGLFHSLPRDVHLGAYAEFGCGPFTQTKTCLFAQVPAARFTSITLLDPNLHNYLRDVPLCSFKSGTLIPGVTTYLVSSGAEAPLCKCARVYVQRVISIVSCRLFLPNYITLHTTQFTGSLTHS